MDLKDFFENTGIRISFAAKKLGVTSGHLGNIINKKKNPSWRLARDISEFTKGDVSVDELLGENHGDSTSTG